MDVIASLATNPSLQPIQCLDMHTTGEPTRIILSGYPKLSGNTLLEQRADARSRYDHIRERLILEPRGHNDMYGAILIQDTELTRAGQAHIGVLFLTNDGYSTMCGHATIALGRFLVDTWDTAVFPRRRDVVVDESTGTARVALHAPCGLVEIEVPVKDDGKSADSSRPVSFVCVPSFATGLDVRIEVPEGMRWPELEERTSVKVDFSYGGAFYCFVSGEELGFEGGLAKVNFEAMNRATRLLKAAVNQDEQYRYLFRHPDHDDLGFLYSVFVVDKSLGKASEGTEGAETGLCFFSDQQLDRSPTGSAVAARDALAVAKGERDVGQKWTYHSLVSNASNGKGGFDSEIVKVERPDGSLPLVWVQVSGFASYTGASTFLVEENDVLGQGGFVFEKIAS